MQTLKPVGGLKTDSKVMIKVDQVGYKVVSSLKCRDM